MLARAAKPLWPARLRPGGGLGELKGGLHGMNDEPHTYAYGWKAHLGPCSCRAPMRSQAPGWRRMSEPGHGERALPDAWWQEYRSPNGGGFGAQPQSTMEARALLAESAGGARGSPSGPTADPGHSGCNLARGAVRLRCE